MDFVIGALGALCVAVLFFGGVFTGWKLRGYDDKRVSKYRAEQLGVEEKKKLEQEAEAFRLIQNYNADRAYGLVPDKATQAGD